MKRVMTDIIMQHGKQIVVVLILLFLDTAIINNGALQLSNLSENLLTGQSGEAIAALQKYIILQILILLLEFIVNMTQNHVQMSSRLYIRNILSEKMMLYSLKDFHDKNSMDFLEGQMGGMDLFDQRFLTNFFDTIYYSFLLINSFIMLSCIYVPLAVSMAVAIGLSCVMANYYDRAVKKCTERIKKEDQKHMTDMMDMLEGFLDIYFNKVRRYFRLYSIRNSERYERESRKYYVSIRSISIGLYLPMFIADNLIMAVILFGIIRGVTDLGTLTVYISIGGLLLNSGENLFACIPEMKSGLKLLPWDIINYVDSNEEKSEPSKVDEVVSHMNKVIWEIRDLSYVREEKLLVSLASLTIREGEKWIITGENGSGKSTFLKLLLGQLHGEKGTVQLCGRDIRELSDNEICRQIGYLPQKGYIFEGTLKENIFFGKEYSKAKIQNVIENSGLKSFVKLHGMDFQICGGGSNLSGGEMQKILMARLFAQEKRIYLLDEPFANMDHNSAADLENYILANPDLTVVIISHEWSNPHVMKYCHILDGVK